MSVLLLPSHFLMFPFALSSELTVSWWAVFPISWKLYLFTVIQYAQCCFYFHFFQVPCTFTRQLFLQISILFLPPILQYFFRNFFFSLFLMVTFPWQRKHNPLMFCIINKPRGTHCPRSCFLTTPASGILSHNDMQDLCNSQCPRSFI